MKTTTQHKVSSPADATVSMEVQSKQPYHVVIAYDEFASGQRAVETCYRLTSQFKDTVDVRVKVWSFGSLRNTAVNLTAASDAAKADMVMIAFSREKLPPSVKKWIEASVLWNGGAHGMLVAILNGAAANEDYPSAEAYLRFVTASRGMEFLLEKNGNAETSGVFFPR